MQIPKVKLSDSGPELSQFIAGSMNWGSWGADYKPTELARIIDSCFDVGMTTIDVADIYGHYTTEKLVGEALSELNAPRESYELVGKCGIKLTTSNRPYHKLKSYDCSEAHIFQSVDTSLADLQTDYLDVLLIHRPDPLLDVNEVAGAFEKLKSAGKVRHFAVSNFTPSQFKALHNAFPLVTNQVQCSPLHPDPIFDGTFDQLIGHSIRPMIWGPLGSGQYFSGGTTGVLRLRTAVREISDKYGGVGEDVVLLAWLLKHPSKPLPILGSTKIERLIRARLALELELNREEWFAILEAGRGKEVA
ncbi:MAG: aldo/keto reductase [Bacteroidota bacterium]